MGQRTQLVLKTKDRFGKVQNKVYHEQWGFAKTMPMIILEFLISLNYGSNGQKRYLDSFIKPRIVSLRELKAMPVKEQEETLLNLEKTSLHNVKLNSWDISEEYEESYVYEDEKGVQVLRSAEVDGVKGIPLLEWDFDINNPNNLRQFTGDNNDGLALVSIDEKFIKNEYGNYNTDYDITIGFVVSDCETIRSNSDKLDEKAINRYHDIYSYCKRYGNYCTKTVLNAINTLYELFDVKQLGKEAKDKV